MEKVNFSGGEPFIHDHGDYLGALVEHCKVVLELPSVSIVSNGSLIREAWFKKYGDHLDILAISCDSFDEQTNKEIGRGQGNRNHVRKMMQIRDWCQQYKVFQCLLLEGENVGPSALKNAERFYINNQQFQAFLDRHSHIDCLVAESNEKMQNSYLILDEQMRFLDCRDGAKKPSLSLLDVGVNNALNASGFDEKMFLKRGGIYVWSKKDLLEW